jgi:hypothetical protein
VNEKLRACWLGLLSLLVALMPLSFAVRWHWKVLPMAVLLLTGLDVVCVERQCVLSRHAAFSVFLSGPRIRHIDRSTRSAAGGCAA